MLKRRAIPKPVRGAQTYVRRIKSALRRRPLLRKGLERRFKRMELFAREYPHRGWEASRGLSEYNLFFGNALKRFFYARRSLDIAAAFSKIASLHRPFRVLEDGPGEGFALSDLKKALTKQGIKSHVIGLAAHHLDSLRELKREREIDDVISSKAEFFLPKERVDAVISVFGSTSYTLRALRKNVILKFVYSLNRNGLLLMGFHFSSRSETRLATISGGLSEQPVRNRTLSVEQEMKGIERAFEKQGFKARFFPVSSHRRVVDLAPNWVLIVQRIE
ncbi:MAG: hypothetical protein J4215_01105 [Candidatus Diapherotrites archaeon]|uniref:Uncharacterized protein n=1 Tax=Candidatus Iainarchaeum sp. TaxID=3101447 RepID=A0A8T4L5N7_9ARCH|nr:hypothetical protein [Candidatus Diapherotrites archaeon]